MTKLKHLLIAVFFSASTVWAGDVEDAHAALDRKDYGTALAKFKIAALKNNAYAQLQIGSLYNEGLGVTRNYVEAVYWWRLAAAQGHEDALNNLGNMFNNGQGVMQDYAEAVRFYRLAAAKGLADAQYNLGLMYGTGQGVMQDYVRAHMWWNLAAMKGESRAVRNRNIVTSRMTSQQIAEAQKIARECLGRNFQQCD